MATNSEEIIKNASVNNLHITVKGITMVKKFQEAENDIFEMDVRDEDVWIVTFPRSGKLHISETFPTMPTKKITVKPKLRK